jgi:hypothetical protein
VDLGSQDRPDQTPHAFYGQLGGQLFPIRSGRCQSIIHFRGPDEARSPWNRLAGKPIGITLAVPALVMPANKGTDAAQVG